MCKLYSYSEFLNDPSPRQTILTIFIKPRKIKNNKTSTVFSWVDDEDQLLYFSQFYATIIFFLFILIQSSEAAASWEKLKNKSAISRQ